MNNLLKKIRLICTYLHVRFSFLFCKCKKSCIKHPDDPLDIKDDLLSQGFAWDFKQTAFFSKFRDIKI